MSDTDDKKNSPPSTSKSIICGAAAVGAAAGLLVGGPIFGIGLGIVGATVAATHAKGTKSGDYTRATGEFAANGFKKVQETEKQLGVINKLKAASVEAKLKFQSLDEQHHIVERGMSTAHEIKEKVQSIDQKYGVVEKADKAIQSGLKKANEMAKPKEGSK